MGLTRFEGDVFVAGTLSSTSARYPAASVGDDEIEALAGIDQTKLEHQHRCIYAQPNTAATTATVPLANIYGATGTLLSVKAGSIAAAVGNSTVTVDVKKNGTTVLSAVITLDNANTAYVVESGTLSVTTLAAGDTLAAVVTATVGTGTLPTGFFVEVRWAEDAQ